MPEAFIVVYSQARRIVDTFGRAIHVRTCERCGALVVCEHGRDRRPDAGIERHSDWHKRVEGTISGGSQIAG